MNNFDSKLDDIITEYTIRRPGYGGHRAEFRNAIKQLVLEDVIGPYETSESIRSLHLIGVPDVQRDSLRTKQREAMGIGPND